MRVGLVASPFIAVPPVRYGGTELFVANLAEALIRAGVNVRVYTNGESTVKGDIRWRYAKQEWPLASENAGLMKELDHTSWAIEMASRECDVIHLNSTTAVLFSRFTDKHVVCTLHHPREESLVDIYERYDNVAYVAISQHQASVHPSLRSTVIQHGIDLTRYEMEEKKQPYLCFLGRICPVKGTHHAIEIAKRTGMQLKIAGEVQPIFQEYFDERIRPHIDEKQIQFLGPADHAMKNELMKRATALLFPIEWQEPFGLVMIEAMACGTPVIAFNRGSVPEVLEDGLTGFVVNDIDGAAAAVNRIDRLFRPTIRSRFEERFSARAMARDYLRVYEQLTTSEDVAAVAAE